MNAILRARVRLRRRWPWLSLRLEQLFAAEPATALRDYTLVAEACSSIYQQRQRLSEGAGSAVVIAYYVGHATDMPGGGMTFWPLSEFVYSFGAGERQAKRFARRFPKSNMQTTLLVFDISKPRHQDMLARIERTLARELIVGK